MRLTERDIFQKEKHYVPISQNGASEGIGMLTKCYDKLGQLEDIEEELGIDLITLFKALKDGAWTKFNNEISKCDECEYQMLDIYIYFYWDNGKHLVFELKDYGKTWALTKEELENENVR